MDSFCYLCFVLSLSYCLVCSLQHCGYLLGRADLLALWYITFSCVSVTFPYGVLGQVCYLIVSIPDLRLRPNCVCLPVVNCDIGMCVY